MCVCVKMIEQKTSEKKSKIRLPRISACFSLLTLCWRYHRAILGLQTKLLYTNNSIYSVYTVLTILDPIDTRSVPSSTNTHTLNKCIKNDKKKRLQSQQNTHIVLNLYNSHLLRLLFRLVIEHLYHTVWYHIQSGISHIQNGIIYTVVSYTERYFSYTPWYHIQTAVFLIYRYHLNALRLRLTIIATSDLVLSLSL